MAMLAIVKDKREYLVSDTKGGANGWTTFVISGSMKIRFDDESQLRDIYQAFINIDTQTMRNEDLYPHPFTWTAAIEIRIVP